MVLSGAVWPGATLDVGAYLGAFDQDLPALAYPSHFLEQHVIEQPINWKIAIDTFLEPYHFGVLHRNSIAPLFLHDCCLVHQSGHHIREILLRKTTALLLEMPKNSGTCRPVCNGLRLFPNTVWVMQRDHIELWRIYPHPTDTGQCVMTMDFMTPEPVTTEKARSLAEERGHIDEDGPEEDFPRRRYSVGTTFGRAVACYFRPQRAGSRTVETPLAHLPGRSRSSRVGGFNLYALVEQDHTAGV